MHLSVQRNIVDDLATIGLEGSAEVVDVDSAERGHQPVGSARGDAAHDEVVTTLGPPSADDVVAFFELGEKIGDFVRGVLKVAIHGEDELTLRVIEPSSESRGLAEVAAQLDNENARVDGGDLFQQTVRAIARAVVDKDELKALADVLHDGFQAVIEGRDIVFFVMKRNDDRVFRHVFDDIADYNDSDKIVTAGIRTLSDSPLTPLAARVIELSYYIHKTM